MTRHTTKDLERKDDSNTAPLDTKDALAKFMGGFEAFKTANDARLKSVERKQADPLAEDQLKKIECFLDSYESVNAKLTQAEKASAALLEVDKRFDLIETMLKRSPGVLETPEAKAARSHNWIRAVCNSYITPSLAADQQKAIDDVLNEYKALNIGTNTEGGYLAPLEMIREIIKTATELSPVRTLARVRQTGLRGIAIAKRTGQFAAQWVAEQGTKAETQGLTYGVQEISTHEFYALIDITNLMLEDSVFNMEEEVRTESAEQFALAEGTAFVNGTGNGQPEGFMTNSNVAATNSGSATTIADVDGQADGILAMKYTLKSFYSPNATFGMNRTTMGQVRRLKDSQKNYIWMPGIAQGRPNTIDGDPYVELPDMPNAGAGTFPIVYGDFRRAYTWVDRLAMELLRDPYTQATAGKVRYIMRKRVGGAVTLPDALKKLRCQVA